MSFHSVLKKSLYTHTCERHFALVRHVAIAIVESRGWASRLPLPATAGVELVGKLAENSWKSGGARVWRCGRRKEHRRGLGRCSNSDGPGCGVPQGAYPDDGSPFADEVAGADCGPCRQTLMMEWSGVLLLRGVEVTCFQRRVE